jgi:hypothetical protein
MLNLGKSLKFAAKGAVKTQMPHLMDTYDSGKEVFKTGTTYAKDFIVKKNHSTSQVGILVNKYMKELDNVRNNAFEDLKTGRLVNFDRRSKSSMDDMGFGDMDMDWDANFGDEDELNALTPVEQTMQTAKVAAKANEVGSNLRTKALMEIVAESAERSTDAVIKNSRKIHTMNMGLMSQMHTETIKTMTDTNNILNGLLEFHNNQVVDHQNKQLVFFDNVLKELREIKEGVAPTQKTKVYKQSQHDSVFGGGGINFKEYGKVIKKNFDGWFGMTPIGMAKGMMGGGMGKMLFSEFKNSPWTMLTQWAMAGLMPKSMKSGMQSLDKSLSGLFSAMVMKINGMKNDFRNPMKSMFGSLFGIETDSKKTIDASKFNKGPMQWNGVAHKSLVEVIPTLLSHILAAIKGDSKVPMYNYATGKFVHGDTIIKDNQDRIKRSTRSSMHGIRENMKRAMGKVQGGNGEFMMGELDSFMDFLVTSNDFYNPLKHKSAASVVSNGLNLKDPRSYTVLRSALLSLPKHLQNTLSKSIIDAKKEMKKTIDYIEGELQDSGLSGAYNNLGKLIDPKGKNGMSDMSHTLKDIRQILLDGIVVYQGEGKNMRGMLSRRSAMQKNSGISQPISPVSHTGHAGGAHNDILSMTEAQLKAQMADTKTQDFTTSGMRKFIQDILGQTTLSGKFRVMKNGMKPKNIVGKGLGKIDNMIYQLIYGREETGSVDGEPGDQRRNNSIMSKITTKLSNAIDKSVKWVDKKILEPLHEKFFGEHGLFTRAMNSIGEFSDKMKKNMKAGYGKAKGYLIGQKNQDGFYTGGLFSDAQNSFMDYSNQLRHFFSGSGYIKADGTRVKTNKDTSVMSYVKKYSKTIMDNLKTGLFGEEVETDYVDPVSGMVMKSKKRKGDGLLSKVVDQLKLSFQWFDNLFKTKKNETPEQTNSALNQWKKELKGFLPKGIAGGVMGMIASAVLPGGPMMGAFLGSTIAFASHSKKFREFLFGNEAEGREGIVPQRYQKIIKEVKAHLPSITAGGILGLGASIILPGGPMMGLMLGSAIGWAAKSKHAQDFLFGKYDDDGTLLKKGLFAPGMRDKLKKVLPAMGAGGVLGMGASIVLPGGPLIGLTLGSAIGFATKSARVQELLFGKSDKDGNLITKGMISPAMREKIKKNMPKGVAGAIFGALSGTFGILSPGGPLLGAIIGSSLSILSTSDKFKNFMFGKEDPDNGGKRKGGVLGSVRDFVREELTDPFRKWAKKKGAAISDWFQSAVKVPMLAAMDPLRKAFSIIGENFKKSWVELKTSFKDAFANTFNKNIGVPLREFMTKNITDPMKKMLDKFFSAIGRGLAKILTAPIKGLTMFANSIIADHERKTGKKYEMPSGGSDNSGGSGPSAGSGLNQDQNNTINQVKLLTETAGPDGKGNGDYSERKKPNFRLKLDLQQFAEGKNSSDPKKRKMATIGSPFIGTIDLDKFYTRIVSIDNNIRTIRDEVHGQLDGVGHNIESIKNMLGALLGGSEGYEGSEMGRGNRKRKGFFGKIKAFIKTPFRMVGSLIKTIVLAPFKGMFAILKKGFIEIPKLVGKTIIAAVKLPFKILGGAFKILGGIGKMITTFFQSDLVKKIGSIAGTILDITLLKPLKGLGFIIGETAKGIGIVLKDTISGLYTLSKKAIPALFTGIGKLTKGIFNLTVAFGEALLGLGKFAFKTTGRIIKGAGRIVGRVFGMGKPKGVMGTSGMSGNPVYVVGGQLDQVHEVTRIIEVVKVTQASHEDIHASVGRSIFGKKAGQPNSTSKAPSVAKSGEVSGGILKKTFSRIGSGFRSVAGFMSRMFSQRWNSQVPRINILDRITRDVKTEEQYHSASLTLLHELTVSNIQILDAVKGENKGSSIWDMLKGLLGGLGSLIGWLKNFKFPKFGFPGGGGPGAPGSPGAPGVPSGGGGPRGPILLPPLTKNLRLPSGGRPNGPISLPNSNRTKPLSLPSGGPKRVTLSDGKVYEEVLSDDGSVSYYKPVNDRMAPTSSTSSSSTTPKKTGFLKNIWNKVTGRGNGPKVGTGAYGDYIDVGANAAKRGTVTGVAKGLLKRVPILGTLLTAGMLAPDVMTLFKKNDGSVPQDQINTEKSAAKKNIAVTGGAVGGGILGGMGAGAALGALAGVETGPGAIITGIIGSIAGAFLGQKGVEALYNKVDLKGTGKAIGDWTGKRIDGLKDIGKGTVDVFKNGGKMIGNVAGTIWNSAPVETIKNISMGLVDATGNLLSTVGYGFKEIGGAFGDRAKEFGGVIKDKFNDWIASPTKTAMGAIGTGLNATGNWISSKWTDWVSNPLSKFGNMISDGFNVATDWVGKNSSTYIGEPLGKFFGMIGNGLGNATNSIDKKFGISTAINDSIDYVKLVGKDISSGWDKLWGGRGINTRKSLEDSSKGASDKGKSIIDSISNWIRGKPKDVGGGDPDYANARSENYSYASTHKGSDMTPKDITMIKSMATKYGVNPHLWLALAETESDFNSKDVSGSGAVGWGQLMPDTGKWIYENQLRKGTYNDTIPYDKENNTEMSMSYLADLMAKFGTNKGIMAYNVGPGTIASGQTSYGSENGVTYLQRIAKNLSDNSGLTLTDVGGTPISFPPVGPIAPSNLATGAPDAVNQASDIYGFLSSQGTGLENAITKKYGDMGQLSGLLSGALSMAIDPYYKPGTNDDAYSEANPSNSTGPKVAGPFLDYSDKQLQTAASTIESRYPMLNGKVVMHDFLAQRLNNIAKAYGQSLTINSGWRSDTEQQRLINEWRQAHPGASEAERKKYVADPATSNHGTGVAADISGWIKNLSPDELAKFGLWRPMSYEDWHFEPIETKTLGNRTRGFLTGKFGDPFNPSPDLKNYLDKPFKDSYVSPGPIIPYNSAIENADSGSAGDVGGGDPRFMGVPDSSPYVDRINQAMASNNGMSDSNTKVIQLLTIIAQAVEKIADMTEESKEYLRTFLANATKGGTSSSPPVAIISQSSGASANPYTDPSKNTRGNKSSVIASISKGTNN